MRPHITVLVCVETCMTLIYISDIYEIRSSQFFTLNKRDNSWAMPLEFVKTL